MSRLPVSPGLRSPLDLRDVDLKARGRGVTRSTNSEASERPPVQRDGRPPGLTPRPRAAGGPLPRERRPPGSGGTPRACEPARPGGDSGIGNSSPSAAIESHTSSTSWMRSAGESLRISSRSEVVAIASLPLTPPAGNQGLLLRAARRATAKGRGPARPRPC